MKVVVSAKIQIVTRPEIVRTIKVYRKGIQICVDVAWRKNITNARKLQPLVYTRLKKLGLQAQLCITCIKQASGMVKIAESKPIIENCSIRYNFPRSVTIKDNILSVSTIKGRIKIPFNIPIIYQKYFDNWKVSESLLRIDKKGRCYFIFCFNKDISLKHTGKTVGIDMGINNLAVTSENIFFNSNKIKQVKRQFRHLRSKLQKKGTRSSQKLLKKMSGRENRYMNWINHNISKNIIDRLNCGDKIIMEDLTGINKKNRGKEMNYWIHNWSFFRLQQFIEYKGNNKGIIIERVNPMYTSQICHRCGKLGIRQFGQFNCFHCNLKKYNADLNASRNLAHPKLAERQANVTSPNIQSNEHKDAHNVIACELMDKSSCL